MAKKKFETGFNIKKRKKPESRDWMQERIEKLYKAIHKTNWPHDWDTFEEEDLPIELMELEEQFDTMMRIMA